MGLEKLISLAVALAIVAALSGRLPNIIFAVYVAGMHIVKGSQTSNWGPALLLPEVNSPKVKVKKSSTSNPKYND